MFYFILQNYIFYLFYDIFVAVFLLKVLMIVHIVVILQPIICQNRHKCQLKMNSELVQNGVSAETVKESVRNIFRYIGEDPDRLGLQGTPDRIVRMFGEIFRGYKEEEKPNITVFQNGADGLVYDGLIIDSGTFYSCCEHHMMPFFGDYWFAYLPHPKGKILGISKIGRVIDYCSAKLQVQERLTRDVVEMLTEALGTEYPPLGMALVMKGEHLCKTMRGARKEGKMTSSYLTGNFKKNAALRSEFLKMIDK